MLNGRLRSVVTLSNGKKELDREAGRGELVGVVSILLLAPIFYLENHTVSSKTCTTFRGGTGSEESIQILSQFYSSGGRFYLSWFCAELQGLCFVGLVLLCFVGPVIPPNLVPRTFALATFCNG